MRTNRRLGLAAAAAFSLAAFGATLIVPREPAAAKAKSLAYDPKSKPFGKQTFVFEATYEITVVDHDKP